MTQERVPTKILAATTRLADLIAPCPHSTWIEIELVGENDQPVANERYCITLPDGSTNEGATNAEGLARVQGFDLGDCQITFPELDKEMWEKI
ncbi:MAG: hypothetical protein B6244_06195 [Candidatus Cloacimonetes bacterium 4572_55]|nr:MAG: hypothetical protein B6244_06195 [Candidatus Cloacimonetes bacterium 4572_55]